MLEKIKTVTNPLTIIAIFAALAEIAGTVALATVDKELQHIFVWFVMAFPTLLVTAFFLTLNLNPKVLYAPSDFRNEENFLNTLKGTGVLSTQLGELNAELETAKDQIAAQVVDQLGLHGDSERKALATLINRELTPIQTKARSARKSASQILEGMRVIDVRELPHTKPCPKCGATMTLNHDDLSYGCDECKHWEWV